MRKIFPSLAFVLAAFASACSHSARSTERLSAPPLESALEPDELVIAATTDFHATLDRAEGLASVIRGLRAKYGDHLLLLDGGDQFQGSLEGNLSKGRAMVQLFNALGLDAAAIGNHDLDYGPDVPGRTNVKPGEDGLGNLKARVHDAKYQWLSANFVKRSGRCKPGLHVPKCNALGRRTPFEPRAVFTRAGQRVCVIGATTPTTPKITRAEFVKGLEFLPLTEVVAAEAKFLRAKAACDQVVLVSHAGILCNSQGRCLEKGDRAEIPPLLAELPAGTLDAVIAGHNHFPGQETINGTPVLQSGGFAKIVGVVHLFKHRPGAPAARFEPFLPVPEKADQPDIAALLKPYREMAAERKTRPVGEALAPFPRNYVAETALGNLFTDALLEAARAAEGADFALLNAGGMRASLPAGKLTYGDVFAVSPFDNGLVIADLTGTELLRVLEIAFSGGHGISPVSGLHIKMHEAKPGERGDWDRDLNGDGKKEDWERNLLLEVTDEHGRGLKPDARYKLATVDFLTQGGDHQDVAYAKIPKERLHNYVGIWERDVAADYISKHPGLKPEDFYSPDKPRVELVPAPRR